MGSNTLATWAILLFLSHSTISHPRGFVFVVPPPWNILLPTFTWLPSSYHPGLTSNVTLQFKVGSPFMYQFQSLRNLHISKSHTKQVKNKEKCQLEIIQSSSTVQWINCGIFIQWDSTAEGQGMNNSDGTVWLDLQSWRWMKRKKSQNNACGVGLIYTTFKYIVWGYSHICGKTMKKSNRMINKVFRGMVTSLQWGQQGEHRSFWSSVRLSLNLDSRIRYWFHF